jgi:hypothetical protein
MIEWFHGCNKLRDLFTQDTRQELERLALDGHAMARYLYAIWKPEQALEPETFANYVRWQLNAIQFSDANLEAGEVAGLVAYSHTLSQGLFTGRSDLLAEILRRSSYACGYRVDGLAPVTEFDEVRHRGILELWGLTAKELNVWVTEYSAICH